MRVKRQTKKCVGKGLNIDREQKEKADVTVNFGFLTCAMVGKQRWRRVQLDNSPQTQNKEHCGFLINALLENLGLLTSVLCIKASKRKRTHKSVLSSYSLDYCFVNLTGNWGSNSYRLFPRSESVKWVSPVKEHDWAL